METLSYIIPYAHKKNVKIDIALNTLIKQNELKKVIDIIYQLEQMGVDSVIVQDLAIADIANNFFPKINLHASSQMVIHNSIGAKVAEKHGFKRIILARELSLDEIESVKKSTALELEVFIHGALCYSLSGLCLASSYLGGFSGNRGRCTQVCRRRFTTGNNSGFYFSAKDLCAIDHIINLKNIGIHGFKIEGRMRIPEYVYTVVSSYRKVIDNPELLNSTKKDLHYDFGRDKTTFFMKSPSQKNIIVSSHSLGTGIFLGAVNNVNKEYIEVDTNEKLNSGDKIRLHIQDRTDSYSTKINKIFRKKQRCRIYINNSSRAKNGDHIYLINRKKTSFQKLSDKQIKIMPIKFKKNCTFSRRIIKSYNPSKKSRSQNIENKLYLRINNIEWLYLLKSTNCEGIIFQCQKGDFKRLSNNSKLYDLFSQKLIIALPPFIPEKDIPVWKKKINDLHKVGVNKWMCGQFGEKELLPYEDKIYADSTIWSINRATQQFLKKSGFHFFSYSPEDDNFNLSATGDIYGLIMLFSYIPVFISKIRPMLPDNSFIKDNKGYAFFLKKQNGLYYLLGDKPFCLFHRRNKLNAIGIYNFVIDLSFLPAKRKILKNLLSHYYNKEKMPGTTLFNHKAGLK